jgi:hypothetical protein
MSQELGSKRGGGGEDVVKELVVVHFILEGIEVFFCHGPKVVIPLLQVAWYGDGEYTFE